MARKTVDVQQVKDKANLMLEDSITSYVAERYGIGALLESILMDTGNYKGFRWTDGDNGRTDASRRFYF